MYEGSYTLWIASWRCWAQSRSSCGRRGVRFGEIVSSYFRFAHSIFLWGGYRTGVDGLRGNSLAQDIPSISIQHSPHSHRVHTRSRSVDRVSGRPLLVPRLSAAAPAFKTIEECCITRGGGRDSTRLATVRGESICQPQFLPIC